MATASSVQGTGKAGARPTSTAQAPPPAAAPAQQDPKIQKTLSDLQAIVSKRGLGDPIAAQANQLLQQLQQDPSLVNDSTYQAALTRVGRAVSQADAGGNPTALARDAAPTVSAVTQTVGNKQAAATSQKNVDLAQSTAAGNQQFFDSRVTPLLGGQYSAAYGAGVGDQNALAQQTQSRNTARDALATLNNEQRGNAATYNQQGTDLYNNYASGQNALNVQDQAALGKYMGETDPLMTQLQARGWGADVQNDPEGLAAQRNALSMAQGAANGSLDYTAAQAASNAADVRRQQQSYGTLAGIGSGSLDYQSQAARAYANPEDLANQKAALAAIVQDRMTGNAQQQDAYNTIKSRTDVAPTAQEAYLAEVARRKFENDDRSSRQAIMEDLGQRGIRSGSAEIANQLAERENLSQDRTLAELGMNANAIQRAQNYTGMQANQANAMRNSSQQGLGLESNLSTNMRNAGFDEAYKRGVGADTASANNQGTRLSGSVNAGNMATNMRNASDNMSMFNTGQTNQASANNQSTRSAGISQTGAAANSIRQANDAIATFNKTGSQTAQQYQDTYAQNEATRVGNLSGQRLQGTLNTTNQDSTRNTGTYQSGADLNTTNYNRLNEPVNNAIKDVSTVYGMDTDVNNLTADVGQRNFNRFGTMAGTANSIAGTRAMGTTGDLNNLIAASTKKQADEEALRAQGLI